MNILLCDVDGVLLNWVDGFTHWIQNNHFKEHAHYNFEHDNNCSDTYDIGERFGIPTSLMYEYIQMFNQTIHFSHLLPLPGSRQGLQYLVNCGWVISTVSSYSNDYLTRQLREDNLNRFFNRDWFYEHHQVGLDEGKTSILRMYKDKYPRQHIMFLDDKPEHVQEGLDLDIDSRLFIQPWNIKADEMRTHYGTDWESIKERYK